MEFVLIYIIFIIGFILLIRYVGKALESWKYPHRRCPFCGSDVPGHREHYALNDDSFLNYNCPNCGAYVNANSRIWHRKKANAKDDFDVEMRYE